MAVSFCPEAQAFFCASCASAQSEVESAFWAWKYYFSYQSPWSEEWAAGLDRLEYDGKHPLQNAGLQKEAQAAVSEEEYRIATHVPLPVRNPVLVCGKFVRTPGPPGQRNRIKYWRQAFSVEN